MCIADIKKLFLTPNAFFLEKKKQTSLVPSLKLYVIALVVSSAIAAAIMWIVPNPLFQQPGMGGILSPIGVLIGGIVGGIVGIFIGSGIIHIFAMILGGKRGYARTFNAMAYASVPAVLLEWLIYVHPAAIALSLLFFLWFFYLFIVAMSAFHEVSRGRALVIVIVPFIVMVILAMIVAFFLAIFLITAVVSGGGMPDPITSFN